MIYGHRYNLFDLRQKFIWFEKIFIWSKDILFESNKFCFIKTKHFFTSKKVFQINNFFDSIKYFFWVHISRVLYVHWVQLRFFLVTVTISTTTVKIVTFLILSKFCAGIFLLQHPENSFFESKKHFFDI